MDPINDHFIVIAQPSTSKAANFNSSVVDLQQFRGNACVVLNAGAATAGDSDGALNIRLMGSAESNGANAVNLNINFNAASNANLLDKVSVDVRTGYRYLKAVAVISGTNSPAFPVGLIVIGQKREI